MRLAYPHLPMPPQLDAFTSGAQRWLWPLGLLLLLASLHARYALTLTLALALALTLALTLTRRATPPRTGCALPWRGPSWRSRAPPTVRTPRLVRARVR